MSITESGDQAKRTRIQRRKFLLRGLAFLAVLPVGGLALSGIAWKVRKMLRQSGENIHELVLAILDYNKVHGRLPPGILYSGEGKPLHSWRVLILPFIGRAELYEEFHLGESWDSAHNIDLLPRMPAPYAPPSIAGSKVPAHHTAMHVFVGPGTAFEGSEGLRFPADFPNGESRTILVVEAGDPVPWTKPEEISYDPNGSLPDLRGPFDESFWVGTADSSARRIRKGQYTDRVLHAHIDRKSEVVFGGEW